jgi:hypothetical protein
VSTAWHGQLLRLLAASGRATLHLLWPSKFAAPESTSLSHELPMGGAILLAVLALAVRSAS